MPDVSVVREIDPAARIAPDATIGSYCVIGPDVTIGPGTTLVRRVTVVGHTIIGSGNYIEEGCVLGCLPQDLKYKGWPTLLVIGHRNRFGRAVTAHIGTETGGYVTAVGSDNVLMDGCHVAHDCYVDDRTYLGSNVSLAGHIRVHEGAIIEESAGVMHFVTIGKFSRVGARTPVRRDVPPYTQFFCDDYGWGSPPAVRGINEDGIKAARLPADEEKELRRALLDLFNDESALQTKIEQLVNMGVDGEVAALCDFCQQSLQGVYGRYRELLRGKVPPEAEKYLSPELRAIIKGQIK